MKKCLFFVVCFFLCFSLTSCKGTTETLSQNQQQTQSNVNQQNSNKKKTEETKQSEQNSQLEKEAKNNQIAVITKTGIEVLDHSNKIAYPDYIIWNLQNNSNDVIKNYKVSMLAYDEHGYPIKIEGKYKRDFEIIKDCEAANIQPKGNHGEDIGYPLGLAHKIAYPIAIVKELEFYNRDKWENPYYKYWIKNYKEKPRPLEELKSMYK